MKAKELYDYLKEKNVDCFCGVPDSLLKDFCAYLEDNVDDINHTVVANEGNAIALACGNYLASRNIALVYMQNSGIGNCINPLLSLSDEEVYNIPFLMFIGWRGEPNQKDEPQHIKQGKLTDKLLDKIGIKYEIMSDNFEMAKISLDKAFEYMKETKKPFAFIIRKNTFEKYIKKNDTKNNYTLEREVAIEEVLKTLKSSDVIVSTTGHISREVYEIREKYNQSHKQDFLTVGSMGHSSSIALGIALKKPDRNIYCFDGDGSFLMHQGALIVNASKNLSNFKHIIFNNEAHDSVGAQTCATKYAHISKIALNSGYKKVYSVKTKKQLLKVLPKFISNKCTSLLEIKVKCGARADLGRPKEKPVENKEIFMENLNQVEFCYKGAIKNLSKILKEEKFKKPLVFTGKKSFEKIKPIIDEQFKKAKPKFYSDFSTNPKKEEIDLAIKKIKSKYDVIIAIGGGSVIDFAKAFRYYSKTKLKLIAIPTTFGTGSEATQFAVIYIDNIKQSLDEKSILPEFVIIDANFSKNTSKYLKACCAMDAYCQAIESFWSVKSTDLSRKYAKKAIQLCRENIVDFVNTEDEKASLNMALASNLAGKAINISRTTASHALSYKITTKYGIPHGHAVALTIKNLIKKNFELNCEINDTRGKEYLSGIFDELKNLFDEDIDEYFNNLFKNIELEMNFEKLNIKDTKELAISANLDRMKNNPLKLSHDDLLDLFKNL